MSLYGDFPYRFSVVSFYKLFQMLTESLKKSVSPFSMARSYRASFIETSGGMKNMFAHKIFCSWDYGISNRKAAQLKHSTIFNELIECLQDIYDTPKKLSNLRKFWIISTQLMAHLIVFCMLGGLAFGMWALLHIIGDNKMHNALAPLYVSLSVNLTIGVFQIFFAYISKYVNLGFFFV